MLKWPKVAKRVEYLIEHDKFLKAGDYSRMPVYEREQMDAALAALPLDFADYEKRT